MALPRGLLAQLPEASLALPFRWVAYDLWQPELRVLPERSPAWDPAAHPDGSPVSARWQPHLPRNPFLGSLPRWEQIALMGTQGWGT